MPYRALSASLLILILSACSSTAPQGSQAEVPATNAVAASTSATSATPAKQSGDEMICRKELVAGSNRRREVCLTRDQRREIRRNSQNEFNRNRSLRD